MPRMTPLATACLLLLTAAARADAPPAATQPADPKPLMTVSGTVTLDGKPAPDIRVTDGVHFATTNAHGRYTLPVWPAASSSFLPSRTIGVSWPSNTWPIKDEKTGRWSWWIRVKDITDVGNVNFQLATRKHQTLPVCVSFGTDAHDNFERESDKKWSEEVGRAGKHVAFSVHGGDLGYIGADNADAAYTSVAKFTHAFPGTLLNIIGNHDMPVFGDAGYDAANELAGHGAFTKYVGPVRWSFDYAGIHFIGMNWPYVKPSDVAWLDRDLGALPKGTPAYMFLHMWDPFIDPILAKYPNLKLVLCGHSHRNIFAFTINGIDFWTKMSLYTLLYADRDGYQFVDRCTYQGGRTGWDEDWAHHRRACALANEWPHLPPAPNADKSVEQPADTHPALKNITLTSETKTLPALPDATYDLRWGARGVGDKPAKRFGLRITGQNGKVYEFVYDRTQHMVSLMGMETYFNPDVPHIKSTGRPFQQNPDEQVWTEMRIFVMPDRIRVLVNSRLHYQQYLPGAPKPWGAFDKNRPLPKDTRKTTGFVAKKIEFFAEDGSAEFGRVDAWPRQWKDYVPRRQANSG